MRLLRLLRLLCLLRHRVVEPLRVLRELRLLRELRDRQDPEMSELLMRIGATSPHHPQLQHRTPLGHRAGSNASASGSDEDGLEVEFHFGPRQILKFSIASPATAGRYRIETQGSVVASLLPTWYW